MADQATLAKGKDVFGLREQAEHLLRKGRLVQDGFTNIRQRHMWSEYTFHSSTGGSISAAGLLASGQYLVFAQTSGQNGQGLPAGLVITDRETNFPGAGRVSDQQNFAVWELGVGVWPVRPDVVVLSTANMNGGDVNPEDMDAILGSVVVNHRELTNAVPLGLGSDFATPGGPSITVPTLLDSAGNNNVALTGGGLGEGKFPAPFAIGRQARLVRNGGNLPPAPGLRRRLDIPILLRNGDQFTFMFDFPRTLQLRTAADGGTGSFVLRLDMFVVESYRRSG